MTVLEQVFFWGSVVLYLSGSFLNAYRFIFRKKIGLLTEDLLICGGLAANILALAIHSVKSGHFPIRIQYESNLIIAALVAGTYLVLRRKVVSAGPLGMVSIPVTVLLLFGGYASAPDTRPLTPDYFSRWMYLHVLFTMLATVCLVFALGASILYLLRGKYLDGKVPAGLASLPSGEELTLLSFRLVLYGFVCWTVMLITGSLWAKDFWGIYWSWDPVETWSLVSWLAWGVYIHLFLTCGWRGKKLAWLCIFIFITSVISIWGVKLISPDSYHNLQQLRTPLQQ